MKTLKFSEEIYWKLQELKAEYRLSSIGAVLLMLLDEHKVKEA